MIKTKMLAVLMVSLMAVVSLTPLVGGEDVNAETETNDIQKLYGVGYNGVGQIGIENNSTLITPTQINSNIGSVKKIVNMIQPSNYQMTMVLSNDGKLYAIGYDYKGQFGGGSSNNSYTTFTQIATSIGTIKDFVLTKYNTFVVTDDGKLYGCGYNRNGQITPSASETPVTTFTQIGSTLGTITKVWAYEFSSFESIVFFMTDDGKLYGYGNNPSHIISETSGNITTPTQIGSTLGTITDFYYSPAGGSQGASLFIITSTNGTYAVGYNSQGMLGIDDTNNEVSVPTQITTSIGDIVKIGVINRSGASATIFQTSDGNLYGAGHTTYGGTGSVSNSKVPNKIGASLNVTFTDFKIGNDTIVAKTTDNTLYGWGSNMYGQLGNNVQNPTQFTTQSTPIAVMSGFTVEDYISGATVVVLTTDGKLYAAGSNYDKIIDPNSDATYVSTFTQIGADLGTVTKLYGVFVFQTSDGKVYASGANSNNQYGYTSTNTTMSVVQIYNGMNIVDMQRDGFNTFAYTTSGGVYTMGYNNNYVEKVTSITEYTLLTDENVSVVKVFNGTGATLYLTDDGRLFGTGGNYNGTLATGGSKNTSTFTQIGADLGTIVDAAISITTPTDGRYGSTYMLTDDGKLYGCGYNSSGQLGTNVTSDKTTPIQIGADLGTIIKVDIGNSFVVFLTDDGKLYGCGSNANGNLGQGDTVNKYTPVQIGADLGTIVDVITSSSSSTLIFKTSDGKLYGCGYNANGNLGQGDTVNKTTPVQIGADLGTIVKIKMISNNTYIITDDGKLFAAGINTNKSITSTTSGYVTTFTQMGDTLGEIIDVGYNPSYGTIMLTADKEIYQFRQSLSQKDVSNIGVIDKLISNSGTTFLITEDKKLYGYGANYIGQIASPSSNNITEITRIGTSNNVLDVSYGEFSGNASYSTAFYIAGPQRAEITLASSNDNYGTVSSSTLMVDPGDTITISGNTITYGSDTITATPTAQTTTNVYNFNGWYNGATLIQDGTVTVTEDMTITANFSENVRLYDVTIASSNTDYGTVSSALVQVPYNTTIASATNTITLGTTPDATVVTATPTTSDAQYTYAFSDWTGVPVGGYITEATSITANFTQTLNSYTITWVIGETSTTETYDYGEMPTHENPTPPEGYYFAGWNPEIATVTGDQTYTAVFSNMTVTFDAGKGTLDGGASKVVVIGQPIGELPECTPPTNYTFDGWYTAATGGTKVTEDTIVTQDASFTLYAHYELVPALQPVKAILDILPILMAVGLILGAVYVFITRPELATGNNLLYAIVGISVTILVLATFIIPIIGSAL